MSEIEIRYTRQSKFPAWATPQRLKALKETGLSLQQIADMFEVSRQAVHKRIAKAG